jgi:NAD(P)-dependent dehydrogenase (short-subunit alcohol dehydrogenase family)
MVDRVAGKVALVTGAARGQGRADALRLAEESADVIVGTWNTVMAAAPHLAWRPRWARPSPRMSGWARCS